MYSWELYLALEQNHISGSVSWMMKIFENCTKLAIFIMLVTLCMIYSWLLFDRLIQLCVYFLKKIQLQGHLGENFTKKEKSSF